jgi:hypothetical protein
MSRTAGLTCADIVSGKSVRTAAWLRFSRCAMPGGAQGGHIGFAAAGSDFTATQPGGGPLYGTLDLFRPYDFYTGAGSNFAGFQAGYNVLYKSGLLLGFEADISFPGNMSGARGGA